MTIHDYRSKADDGSPIQIHADASPTVKANTILLASRPRGMATQHAIPQLRQQVETLTAERDATQAKYDTLLAWARAVYPCAKFAAEAYFYSDIIEVIDAAPDAVKNP